MKKNPLSEIYESKVLTSESVPSNKVKGEKELDSKIDAKKAHLVAGQGPEAAKKDLKSPEEIEGTAAYSGKAAVLKDSVEAEEPKKAFEGSFEKLFKATINENSFDDASVEMDVTVPTSDEEMADELKDESDEVADLVSDLKDLLSKVQTILDKVSNEVESSEENELEAELGEEEPSEEHEEETEDAVKEAVDLKPVGKAGHDLMSKGKYVVKGAVKVAGGKADSGTVESDPELKPAKSFDKSLQSPKGKPEVKSTVKKGEFFK